MNITQLLVQIDTDKPGELYLLANEGGQQVGMLTIGLDEEHTGWISNVFVAEASRRQGVGRQLLEQALTECRQRGKDYASLSVADKNEEAQRLYKSLGFAPFMTGQPGYYQYILTL